MIVVHWSRTGWPGPDGSKLSHVNREEIPIKRLQTFEGHINAVDLVVFSRDLIRLASASCDDMIKIWAESSGVDLMLLA